MLRLFFIVIVLCGVFCASAQEVDKSYVPEIPYNSKEKVSYTEVVQVPDATREQLYLRAKAWFSNAFKDSKEVIQMDDRESGTIMGKGNKTIWLETAFVPVEVTLHFTVKVFCKEGRYKYEITDMSYSGWVESYHWKSTTEEMFDDSKVYKKNKKTRWKYVQYMQKTEKACEDIANSIKAKMKEEIGSGGSDGDDW